MSDYLYLLDIIDNISQSNITNDLDQLSPNEWFENINFLHFITDLIQTITHTSMNVDILPILVVNTSNSQLYDDICTFINESECCYLPILGNINAHTICHDVDTAGLILDYILSEYQLIMLQQIPSIESLSPDENISSFSQNNDITSSYLPQQLNDIAQNDLHNAVLSVMPGSSKSSLQSLSNSLFLSLELMLSHIISLVRSFAQIHKILHVDDLQSLISPSFLRLSSFCKTIDVSQQSNLSSIFVYNTIIKLYFNDVWKDILFTFQKLAHFSILQNRTSLQSSSSSLHCLSSSSLVLPSSSSPSSSSLGLPSSSSPSPPSSLSSSLSYWHIPFLSSNIEQALVELIGNKQQQSVLLDEVQKNDNDRFIKALQMILKRLSLDYQYRHNALTLRCITVTQTFVLTLFHTYCLTTKNISICHSQSPSSSNTHAQVDNTQQHQEQYQIYKNALLITMKLFFIIFPSMHRFSPIYISDLFVASGLAVLSSYQRNLTLFRMCHAFQNQNYEDITDKQSSQCPLKFRILQSMPDRNGRIRKK